jgi:hypothetical protein
MLSVQNHTIVLKLSLALGFFFGFNQSGALAQRYAGWISFGVDYAGQSVYARVVNRSSTFINVESRFNGRKYYSQTNCATWKQRQFNNTWAKASAWDDILPASNGDAFANEFC